MDLKVKDRVFMVAASSKGLGYGISKALAAEGASLSMGSRSLDSIKSAAYSLSETYGVRANGYVLDASSASSIAEWCEGTLRDFGRIDGVVVNAGGPPAGGFDSFTDEDWAKAYELTLMSAVRMIRGVLPSLRKNGGGAILTVTSSSVKEPIEGLLLSNVFRSGVASLVKSLSKELAKDHIRVNNLVPGRIDTDRVRSLDAINAERRSVSESEEREKKMNAIPLGRYGAPEEFGSCAAYLLSGASSYVTGATLVVDGGASFSLW